MIQRRSFLRGLAALAALPLAALVAAATPARAQQLGEGMDRSGTLDVRNDEERRVFGDLQCTCGCPRESIATCTCGFAAGFRNEVRAMMARGMSEEEIKAEWVRRHGTEALTAPPAGGASRLLYVGPLVLVVAMAAFALMLLRRFRRHGDAVDAAHAAHAKAGAPAVAGGKRDDYDDKLDEELKQLDDE